MALTIGQRRTGDVTILDLDGRLVLGDESIAFRERVRDVLADGNSKILVNLAGVSYLDSSGVGELVSAFASANRKEASLKLLRLTEKTENLLQLTKLLTVFEVFDDEADAVASFA
jgi:anti-sigma B factor antagonist